MAKLLYSISSIFYKELISEFRNRTSLSSVFLFILTSITIVTLSIFKEEVSSGISAGILWLLMFFNSMLGLTKSFISEEERGTSLFLKLHSKPLSVYFGKLFFNILFAIQYNLLTALLYIFFNNDIQISSLTLFLTIIIIGSFALASVSTIISAIIARASNKNALFPILSFPIVLPIIVLGVKSLIIAIDGEFLSQIFTNGIIIFSYSVIVILITVIIFDYVWKD
jgi:heme exporter protein B